MGARGPQPGFKAARAAALAAGEQPPKPAVKKAPAVKTESKAFAPVEPSAPAVMSAADRDNPAKLTGQPLRDLAYRRGLSRSELERIGDDDEKIREQLRYVTARIAEEELG